MAAETTPGDLQLAGAAREGDLRAAGELIRRHAPGVVTLLSRVLRDRELALDLSQETFLRAYRAFPGFDAARSFRAWVRSIAWNLALDHLRRRKRRGERVGLGLPGREAAEDGRGDPDEPADHREEAPPARLERREEEELVRRALDLLPPEPRAVLVLRDLEGLSYEEVAEVLGCPLGTAKSRIHRARMEFRDVYLKLAPSIEEPL